MKVCIFSTTYFPSAGGAERFAHGLGVNLSSKKIESYLLVPLNKSLNKSLNFPYKILSLRLLKICKINRYLYEIILFLNLFFYHLKYKFDIIQAVVLYEPGFIASVFGKIFNVLVFVRPTGEDIQFKQEINYGKIADPFYQKRVKKTLELCTKIVSISPTIRKDIIKMTTPAISKKIVDIPNGVEIKRFDTIVGIDITRKFGISKNDKILFSVGRNVLKKDYPTTLKAFKLVLEKFPNTSLVLVGGDTKNLKEQADGLGISKKTYLLGKIPKDFDFDFSNYPNNEILSLYQNSYIFVFSSLVEGCPNVILEAIASKKPIVAADSPGTWDYVKDGEAGLLFKPQDYKHMADKIIDLLTNKKLYKDIVVNQINYRSRFSWSKIADEYIVAYTKLAELS